MSPRACTSAPATVRPRATASESLLTRGPVVPWRRLVALLVLACIGFSAVEVVWAAETVGVAAVGAATDSALPAGDPQDGPTETHPEEDCPCLCECACANT